MSFAGSHDSFVFIRRNIPGSVFSEPKLLSSKLPDDVMVDWTSKRLTSDDWTNEFQAIDGIIEPLTSVEEIQTESDFLVESSLMRTPAKRKKDSFAGEEYEGIPYPAWKNRKYARAFPMDPQDLDALISAGVKKGVVTTTVANIETYIEGLSDAMFETNSINHDRLVNLEGNLEVMIGMVQTIRSRVGSSVDIGEKYTAPTLWGSTAFIAEDLFKVAEDFSALRSDVVNPMKEMMTALKASDSDHTAKNDKVVRTMKVLLGRIQALNEAVDDVKTDLVLVRTEQSTRYVTPGSTPEDATDELMDYIMSEDKDMASTARRSSTTSAVVTPTKGSLEDDDEDKSVMSILSKLVEDVRNLQSGKKSMSIQFAGLGFTELSDCAAWIEKNYSGYQYGLIMDPLLMLDRIYGDDDVSDSDAFLKSMEVRYKMKIDSGNEAAALNALMFARPRIFHEGRPTIVSVQNKSRLNFFAHAS